MPLRGLLAPHWTRPHNIWVLRKRLRCIESCHHGPPRMLHRLRVWGASQRVRLWGAGNPAPWVSPAGQVQLWRSPPPSSRPFFLFLRAREGDLKRRLYTSGCVRITTHSFPHCPEEINPERNTPLRPLRTQPEPPSPPPPIYHQFRPGTSFPSLSPPGPNPSPSQFLKEKGEGGR